MKTLTILALLFTTQAFAKEKCENTALYASLADSAALFCPDSCNIMDVLGPSIKKAGKKHSLNTQVELMEDDGIQKVFHVQTIYTDSTRNAQEISEYQVVTDQNCLLQSMTRSGL